MMKMSLFGILLSFYSCQGGSGNGNSSSQTQTNREEQLNLNLSTVIKLYEDLNFECHNINFVVSKTAGMENEVLTVKDIFIRFYSERDNLQNIKNSEMKSSDLLNCLKKELEKKL